MKIRLSVAAMPIISDTDVPTLPSSMGCGKQGTWLQDVKVFNIMYFVSPCLSFHQTFLLSLCTQVFPFSLSLPFLQNARTTSILCCVPGVSDFYSRLLLLTSMSFLSFFIPFFFFVFFIFPLTLCLSDFNLFLLPFSSQTVFLKLSGF